jgi:deoxycytidine triphosphate deaminase
MSSEPWKDWCPGVLSKEQILALSEEKYLEDINEGGIGLSAFDLHLTKEGYELMNGTIKPCGDRYFGQLQQPTLARKLTDSDKDGEDQYELNKGKSYIFKLKERLHLSKTPIYGQATARSSVGRVDVLARLIVDGMKIYEGFHPDDLTCGDLFVEITPITFDVRVKEGISLNQLRLFYGDPKDSEIKGKYSWLLDSTCDNVLSVDLTPIQINGQVSTSAFKAKQDQDMKPIDLWENDDKPEPSDYWEMDIFKDDRLVIRKDRFYILRSKEKIALPAGIAVYCRAIDETIGEMRIHYAGFAHPYFGRNRDDGNVGTPLIFEVRGHSADVNLKNGEKLAKLIYYRMSKEAEKPTEPEHYDKQTLKLSAFFGDW